MATSNGKFLRGVLGPVVLRVVEGEQYTSTRVDKAKLKKTPEMIKASATFGMSSILGGKIRMSFDNYIDKLQDKDCSGRLSGQLFTLLKQVRDPDNQLYSFDQQSFDGLAGFDFNTHSPQKKWLLTNPELNFDPGRMQLNWQAGTNRSIVKFHAEAKVCKITMALSFFRLEEGFMSYFPLKQHLLLHKDEAVTDVQTFDFSVPAGCLCILGLFQTYLTSGGMYGRLLNHKKFSPAGILDARITPEPMWKSRNFAGYR